MTPETPHEPIAIVGIGCALPGARGPQAFWQLLKDGREAIREVPPERFDIKPHHDPTLGKPGKIVTTSAGFIDDIDLFEPGFFGISPREADSMDPQQRLLLEVAWEALEDAGITRTRLSNHTAGVFIGMSSAEYGDMLLDTNDLSNMDVYTLSGTARSILAGRISHAFDLKGPSIAVDTACSSSLVAVHLACQSIWSGDCDLALAGGVNLILTPEPWAVLSLARIISPDGRARVFDARANGFVRGEGAGVVVLKPLAQAQADGYPIYAVIRGSASNNDGRNSSVMTPNQHAQEAVLRAAYRHAGVTPGAVHYVEAHGTGTSVGDPIEARALGAVMAEGRPPGTPCRIGSVKTNIGHLEAAAGISGLIKAALCLQHRAIPPSLHFEVPNPAVPWDELPLIVQREYGAWPTAEGAALAGVSSFGISGTNVHVVLSDAPAEGLPGLQPTADSVCLLPLSAHTPNGLAETVARFQDFLDSGTTTTPLSDICYTAGVRRNHHAHRLAFVGRSRQEMADQLAAWRLSAGEIPTGALPGDGRCGPVFVFSGQGSQFWPVDASLLTRFPVFRETLVRCESILRAHGADWSLLDQLTAQNGGSRLQETAICQIAIFACQVAVAAQWRAWGIAPSAVIGHSLGEVAAAHVAGALPLDQAIRIVTQRGRITAQAAGKGAMALVALSPDAATEMIRGYASALAVAVNNSPTNSVISGDPAALAEILDQLQRRDIFARRLPAIDYAAHSPQMEPLKHELALSLAGLAPQHTAITFYSTVTTTPIDGAELNPRYWADNLREPVRFDQTLRRALADGHRVFLEVHPTQVLQRPMQEVLAQTGVGGAVYPSLQRDADGPASLLRSLGNLFAHGCPVRWEGVYPQGGRHVALPPMPWQRQRHWLPGGNQTGAYRPRALPAGSGRHPLLGFHIRSAVQPDTYIVETELRRDHPHYLADHQVYGAAVLPAAAYSELALAIAQEIGQPGQYALADFTFDKALVLPPQGAVRLQVTVTAGKTTLSLAYYSRPVDGDGASWVLHAKGRVRREDADGAQPLAHGPSPAAFQSAAEAVISKADHYQMMAAHGLDYGPSFQGIGEIWLHGMEALSVLDLSTEIATELSSYQTHPVMLDVAFQSVAAILHTLTAQKAAGTFLPVALKSLRVHHSLQQAIYAHALLHPRQTDAHQRLTADVCLLDREGRILVEARGLVLQQLAAGETANLDRHLYQIAWQPQPLRESDTSQNEKRGRWLIIDSGDGPGETVVSQLHAAEIECRLLSVGKAPADQVDIESRESVEQFFATLPRSAPPLGGILYLAPLRDTPQSETSAPTGERALVGLLHLVQALVQHSETISPRLWIVTRGAQPVTEIDQIALDQTPVWGMARTVALEYPKLRCSSIDLCTDPGTEDVALLCQELLADGPENQIAYRQGRRWVARLVRYQEETALTMRPATPGEAFRLEMTTPGILDHLTLTAAERVSPAPDQVEIRVHSAGLNFLDVLSALGLRPDQGGAELILGMECAGTVERVGSKVTNFQVGDEVLAVAPHSIGAYTRTRADFVAHKPAGLSFQAAATVPIAYLTAYYALHILGRIRPRERILIHAAAGGVGLAAVQLAKHIGAEIFATAGSPEKRAYLQQLGIAHVMDSRSLDFADEVMACTNGEGVDLVLNALAGEAIPRSLATLRANGRFLEIGKRDIYGHSSLDMGLLKKNIAFFAIDLIPLLAEQPVVCHEMLSDLTALLDTGALPPLPYIEFPIAQAEQAFRYMAQAKHTGKVVIVAASATDDVPVQIVPRPRNALRSDGTYLITGGLGGLGLCVASWLVERGARHLVLLGRNAPLPDTAKKLAALEAQGATVVTVQADVTQERDLCAVLDHIAAALPPLRGLFHAAGLLDNGLLLRMDATRLRRAMAAKAEGAWLLHRLTRHIDLDLFVLFSSATSVLGAPGQANYASANAFLDGLAHYRRSQGLPALAINWGAWAEVGMAAQANQTEHLTQQGILAFSPQQGVQMLERILATSAVQVTALRADWPRLHQRFTLPLLQEMLSAADAPDDSPKSRSGHALRAQLCALAPTERQAAVAELLQKQLAQVLRTPIHRLNPQQPLNELGIDSLMTVELVNRIEGELALTIPLSTLLQGPTLAGLTELVLKLLDGPTSGAPGQTQPASEENSGLGDGFARRGIDLESDALLDPGIQLASADTAIRAAPRQIFLTGATGFVGTFLLHDLLQATDAQIHCLVRSEDAVSGRERLLQALARYFPNVQLPATRIVAVPGDLAQPQLGLSAATFDQLAEDMDMIVHCGAQTNWLASYAALKSVNVLGTQTIIRLAAQCRTKPLHHVSSLAVFPILGSADSVDEQTSLDHGGILYGGYAQSKWVAEKLATAARMRGLPVVIYRPGLVVGHSKTGVWQGENIVANMLRSWIELGMAPNIEAQFDLTPVDYVSRAIVQLVTSEAGESIYHLNNPRTVGVGEMIDWLVGCGYTVAKMAYPTWRREMLRRGDVRRQTILDAVGPLLALELSENVDWLGHPRVGNHFTQQSLVELACPSVDAPTFRAYVEHLQQMGFLPNHP